MNNSESDKREKIKKLGKYIKQLREAHGYSFQKLSELSGLSMGAINQLENGTARSMPKISTLQALAKALGVSEYELQKRVEYLPDQDTSKLIEPNGSFSISPKMPKAEDWKFYYTSSLANLGFKQKYINEIIQYIETVRIKQEIEDGNLSVPNFKY